MDLVIIGLDLLIRILDDSWNVPWFDSCTWFAIYSWVVNRIIEVSLHDWLVLSLFYLLIKFLHSLIQWTHSPLLSRSQTHIVFYIYQLRVKFKTSHGFTLFCVVLIMNLLSRRNQNPEIRIVFLFKKSNAVVNWW